mmetsp:Transcript_448/g.1387  ORF Transcript_448/g.1387 Transcript_448/m.1387 type:complete len:244 (-) Transcript_448:114-845(-)
MLHVQGVRGCRVANKLVRYSSSPEHGVDLYDHALRIEKKDLVPVASEPRAVVGVLDAVRVEVALEGVDVIGAEGDVAYRADADRVDGLTAAEGDAEVSRGEVHLHVAVRREADGHVRAGARGSHACPRKHLDRHLIHAQHIPVELEQACHLATHDVDVVQLGRCKGIARVTLRAQIGIRRDERFKLVLEAISALAQFRVRSLKAAQLLLDRCELLSEAGVRQRCAAACAQVAASRTPAATDAQ